MDNILDDNLPLIIEIMLKLSKKRFGFPTRHYFKSMYEMYEMLDGKTGRKKQIIFYLRNSNIIGHDNNGFYYDTRLGAKLIKESKLSKLAQNHDLGDIFG